MSFFPEYNYEPLPEAPEPARVRVSLSECERAAISLVIALGVPKGPRKVLMELLNRSAVERPNVRYVVKCRSRFAGREWEKVYFDKASAQAYARFAVDSWCDRSSVRIYKQKWISY